MTSPILPGGAAVKGERSESRATPKAPWTAETETKPSNSGEAETPTTDGRMIMEQVQELPVLMTTSEVAKVLQVNRSTLSRWRSVGLGPRPVWLSPNMPRYRSADVADWLKRLAA